MELICIRHGESIGNIACHKSYIENDHSYFTPEFQKTQSCEWPLTETGILHSQKAGEYIKNNFLPIDGYFSSDYPRAKETAIVADLSNAWRYTNLLRERNRGLMDNLSKEQWEKLSKKEGVSFNEDSIDWKPPAGESTTEMIQRLEKFFDLLRGQKTSKILVVTHGELIQCFRFMLRNLPPEKYPEWIASRGDIRNCQIFQFISDRNGTQEVSHVLKDDTYIIENRETFAQEKLRLLLT